MCQGLEILAGESIKNGDACAVLYISTGPFDKLSSHKKAIDIAIEARDILEKHFSGSNGGSQLSSHDLSAFEEGA